MAQQRLKLAQAARRFPLSQSQLVTYHPNLANHLTLLAAYGCQDAASPIVDSVSAKNLIENQPLLYRRTGDPLGRLAVECDTAATTEFAADADTTFASLPAGSARTMILRFATPDNAGVARGLAGTGSLNSGARWGFRITAAGLLTAFFSDGTNTVNPQTVAICDDGAYHDAVLVWDRLAGTPAGRVGMDAASFVSTSLGALSAVTSVTGLRLGSVQNQAAQVGQQASYMALFDGAMSEADFALWRSAV